MKQVRFNYKVKNADLSEVVLKCSDLTPEISTLIITPTNVIPDNEKTKYRKPLGEVSDRQKYR